MQDVDFKVWGIECRVFYVKCRYSLPETQEACETWGALIEMQCALKLSNLSYGTCISLTAVFL